MAAERKIHRNFNIPSSCTVSRSLSIRHGRRRIFNFPMTIDTGHEKVGRKSVSIMARNVRTKTIGCDFLLCIVIYPLKANPFQHFSVWTFFRFQLIFKKKPSDIDMLIINGVIGYTLPLHTVCILNGFSHKICPFRCSRSIAIAFLTQTQLSCLFEILITIRFLTFLSKTFNKHSESIDILM